MKNLETLLSIIAGLLYWILNAYKAHQRDIIPKSEPTRRTEPSAEQYPLPPKRKNLLQPYPIQPYQTISSKKKEKPTIKDSPKQPQIPSKTISANKLERKLARYNSLQRSIVIHEILQPKHFF
jgi:hypothetical protein